MDQLQKFVNLFSNSFILDGAPGIGKTTFW